LLTDCAPPNPSEEIKTLRFLKAKDVDSAATAHASYVLDVRDAFDMCNLKIRNIRKYFDGFKK